MMARSENVVLARIGIQNTHTKIDLLYIMR